MPETPGRKEVKIAKPAMNKNDEIAAENHRRIEACGMFAVNLISSPGSGKTTLLEALAKILQKDLAVIEGDVQTRRDAERVEKAGSIACQIETGGSCHLDAQRVSKALDEIKLESLSCKLLIIENVGNLVCPSSYNLGEHMKAALISLPEGDDKVLKYPSIFRRIKVLLITKIDLQPQMEFDPERAIKECESLNQGFDTFKLSAKTGEGVEEFCKYLLAKQSMLTA
ncbi:MAG: hydrogenase nickel incorporation protein HypB [Planctomycetes bacterium]|nr:hydrogenase nickel incorporation protein HypB [Planctomycetota bacterium]